MTLGRGCDGAGGGGENRKELESKEFEWLRYTVDMCDILKEESF